MKFGEVPVAEAEGAILAHSLKLGTAALKKARVLSHADVELIAAAGLSRTVSSCIMRIRKVERMALKQELLQLLRTDSEAREEVRREIEAAVEFAENSPFPEESELLTDVFTV